MMTYLNLEDEKAVPTPLSYEAFQEELKAGSLLLVRDWDTAGEFNWNQYIAPVIQNGAAHGDEAVNCSLVSMVGDGDGRPMPMDRWLDWLNRMTEASP